MNHKFFEKYLDNDLGKLNNFLLEKYNEIDSGLMDGISPIDIDNDYWINSKSTSTIKWREYNVFQFYNNEIYNLYKGVRETVKEACDYYKVNYEDQQFMIQGWFNVNYSQSGKLDWHDHGPAGAPYFHGYYCVNAEPSITHYKINNSVEINNVNKNNRLVISEMGHPHAMADWDWNEPRVTIAYDIVPLAFLLNYKDAPEQHWFPL